MMINYLYYRHPVKICMSEVNVLKGYPGKFFSYSLHKRLFHQDVQETICSFDQLQGIALTSLRESFENVFYDPIRIVRCCR